MIVRTHHSPLTTHHSPRSGLSLLEVLVALAIFLFSLVGVSQLVDFGSGLARDVDWVGRSSTLAQSRMAEAMAGSLPLTSQPISSCDEDPDWNWSMDAEPGAAPGLFQVRIVVSRQRPDGSLFETVLNQMVLDPTYRGNTDGSATGTDDTSGTSSATTGGDVAVKNCRLQIADCRSEICNLKSEIRAGYTLLEVLLASMIAALLMAALYVSMDVQIRYAQAGREAVNESTVARNLIARIAADTAGILTPITATVAIKSTSGDVATDVVTPLNGGVQGDGAVFNFWVSRVPKLVTGADAANADAQPLNSSDLRRISYWQADGGLARQEIDRVTADDDDTQLPPFVQDEARCIIAPEVTGVTFRYFDGGAWVDTWDGTVLGADEKTPIGPPRAVEITLSIRKAGADPNDTSAIKQYRHVIAINAANAQPTTATDDGTGTSTTTTTTTGGTP